MRDFALTLEDNPTDLVVVERFLASLLSNSPAGSTVRTYLSAVVFATNLGWLSAPIPPIWWKLSPVADRLRSCPKRTWFPLPKLEIKTIYLGLTFVALSLGLRVGEAASLRNEDIVTDMVPPGIWFRAEKLSPVKTTAYFPVSPCIRHGVGYLPRLGGPEGI